MDVCGSVDRLNRYQLCDQVLLVGGVCFGSRDNFNGRLGYCARYELSKGVLTLMCQAHTIHFSVTEAGHGAFAESDLVNDVAGLIVKK